MSDSGIGNSNVLEKTSPLKMNKYLWTLILGGMCLWGLATVFPGGGFWIEHPGEDNGFQWYHAVVLGIVEGVTEYLPVSSTGHLLLVQHFMGLTATETGKAAADAYAVIIQIGAIFAVLSLYRRRSGRVALGLLGRDPEGLRLAVMLVISFIPAAVVGLCLGDWIKAHLFGPWPIVIGWLVGGIIILMMPNLQNRSKQISIENIQWRQALAIGLFQVFALWPGISRSLATIIGGIVAGMGLVAAVEFSFLLGLITLGAATVYEMTGYGPLVVAEYGVALPVVGIICSFAAAWVSVKWLVAYLHRRGLALFGYYRILLATVTGILLFHGIL